MNGKILLIGIILILVIGLFFVNIDNNMGKNNYYLNKLELAAIDNLKKKLVKFSLIGLDVIKSWEQKPSEDKMFEQLNTDANAVESQEVYYQGCGGGEVFLD